MAPRASRSTPTPRPVALVTGASSGIGEALAWRFARAGYSLVLVARRAPRLRSLARSITAGTGMPVRVVPADLATPGSAAALAERLVRQRIAVDVLVNNAGVLAPGLFIELAPAQHQAMVDLNVSGLTAMLSAFLPGMVQRGRGRVLNVASIASFQPVPSLATYAATKAYVLSLTESLAEELRGTGVTVTALCPGITATAMLTGATAARPELRQLPSLVIGRADEVAEAGFQACLAGEVFCVPGAVNQAANWGARVLPRAWVRRMAGAVVRQARGG